MNVDTEKIKMLESFKASKLQIFNKLVYQQIFLTYAIKSPIWAQRKAKKKKKSIAGRTFRR